MSRSFFQQTKSNVFFSFASPLLGALIFLLIVPFFVHRLGIEQYGLWTVATAVTGIVGVFTVIFGDSQIRHSATRQAQGDSEGLQQVTSTALAIHGLWGLIFFGIGAVLLAPYSTILGVPQTASRTGQELIQVVFAAFFLTVVQNALVSLLKGIHRYDLSSILLLGTDGIRVLLMAGVLLFTGSIIWFAIASLLGTFIGLVGTLAVVKLTCPGVALRPRIHWHTSQEMLSFSLLTSVSSVVGFLKSYLPIFVISRVLGPGHAPYYAIPLQISQRLTSISGNITTVFLPIFSSFASDYRQHAHRLQEIASSGVKVIVTPALVIAAAVMFLTAPFLRLWLSESFAFHAATVMYLLLAETIVSVAITIPSYALSGIGKVHTVAKASVVNMGVTLITLPLCFFLFRLPGIALALLFGSLVYLWLPGRLFRLLGVSSWRMRVVKLYAPLLVGPAVAVAVLTSALPHPTSTSGLILQALAFTIIGCIATVAFDFRTFRNIYANREAIFTI